MRLVFRVLSCSALSVALAAALSPTILRADPARVMKMDGMFDDWKDIKSYTDAENDVHDVDGETKDYKPKHVNHPDADLVEYKFAHDSENLYVYIRSKGAISRTKRVQGNPEELLNRGRRNRNRRRAAPTASERNRAGRYYAIVTIDVDNNDETGYWIHEGGYYPTSRGYDVNCEVEWYNGEFNSGVYLNHCAMNKDELKQAFLDQSQNKWVEGKDGPYPAGFMRLAPGTYKNYTQWVYHEDGTITFVRDKGPVVQGIVTGALAKDGHEAEFKYPIKGFLNNEKGEPIIKPGATIDISVSLEASGEMAPDGQWGSDSGEPIQGYVLEPAK
jgi:hypothetical protein